MQFRKYLERYISKILETMTVLLGTDTPKRYPIIEILTRDTTQNGERFFRPFIYNFPIENASNNTELIKNYIKNDDFTKNINLEDLREIYQRCKIPEKYRASGAIFEAWKRGKFSKDQIEKYKESLIYKHDTGNETVNTKDLVTKLIKYLDLGNSELIDEIVNKAEDSFNRLNNNGINHDMFLKLEVMLLHNFSSTELGKFVMCHYPLIVNGYWFVGFLYMLYPYSQEEEISSLKLFNENYYIENFKTFHLISQLLRECILEYAITLIEPEKDFDENFKKIANLVFVCFDEEFCELDSKGNWIRGPKLIEDKLPDWLKEDENLKANLKSDLDELFRRLRFHLLPYECQKVLENIRKESLTDFEESKIRDFLNRNVKNSQILGVEFDNGDCSISIPEEKEISFRCIYDYESDEFKILNYTFLNPLEDILRHKYVDYEKNINSEKLGALSMILRNLVHHHSSHVMLKIDFNNKNEIQYINNYLKYLQEKWSLMNLIGLTEPICEGAVDIIEYLNKRCKSANNGPLFFFMIKYTDLKDCSININNKSNENLLVSPGFGEIGLHALCIFLENFITNLKKHSKLREGQSIFDVNIDISKENDKFAKIEIYSKNYISDNINNVTREFENVINNSPLSTEEGRPDTDKAGLKEMRISANLLRGLPVWRRGKDVLKVEEYNNSSIKYTLRIPLSQYVVEKDNLLTYTNDLSGEQPVKPRFLILKDASGAEELLDNLSLLPQLVCIKSDNLEMENERWCEWLKRRLIFLGTNDLPEDKNEKYTKVLEKLIEKLFGKNLPKIKFMENCEEKKDYNGKFCTSLLKKKIYASNKKSDKIILCHNCQHIGEHITFSHTPDNRINREITNNMNNIQNIKLSSVYEIYLSLLTRIIIFDDEIYKKISNEELKQLILGSNLHLTVCREEDFDENCLKDYHITLIHLGLLDKRMDIYEMAPEKCSPFMRIVTGRPKNIENDILNITPWARCPQIDRTVLLDYLNEEDHFEIKWRIFWTLMT
jgi:hypothetical protein